MHSQKNLPFSHRLRFAVAGIAHALSTERSVRTQAGVFALLLILMIVLRPTPLWWGLVIIASSSVLSTELLNTALERLTDHLHPEMHPEIRAVKDCAAAAVLIAALGALGVAVAFAVDLGLHAR